MKDLVRVVRADSDGSQRCPRCYRYCGIPVNLHGMCDLQDHPDWEVRIAENRAAQLIRFKRII